MGSAEHPALPHRTSLDGNVGQRCARGRTSAAVLPCLQRQSPACPSTAPCEHGRECLLRASGEGARLTSADFPRRATASAGLELVTAPDENPQRLGDGGEAPLRLRELGSRVPRRRSPPGPERPQRYGRRSCPPADRAAIACVAFR
jgi:hypothetical protein